MGTRVPFTIAASPFAMIATYSLNRGVPTGMFGADAQQRVPAYVGVDPLREQ